MDSAILICKIDWDMTLDVYWRPGCAPATCCWGKRGRGGDEGVVTSCSASRGRAAVVDNNMTIHRPEGRGREDRVQGLVFVCFIMIIV